MFNSSKLIAGLAHKMGLQMRTWKFHYVSNIISFFFFWLIFTNSFKSIILDFEKDSWKFNFTNQTLYDPICKMHFDKLL